jgi:polyvinyl alcohol dehydrogenase (cytochrome)
MQQGRSLVPMGVNLDRPESVRLKGLTLSKEGASAVRRWRIWAMAGTVSALIAGTLGAGLASGATTFANWPQYLFSSGHKSENAAAKAITPANAASVKVQWKFSPAAAPIPGLGGFFASPTVYNGVVYIGARNGHFYAINENTGTVIWDRNIGFVTGKTCGAQGFTSTATVKKDPTTGKPTVYVYGATGYLYAMDAATGKNVWPKAAVAIPSTTVNDYYAWASPLVFGGNIYVGISSQCDKPLVRGGMKEFSQKTGVLEHTYWSTPVGSVGASIWSSPAAIGKTIFTTTGNGPDPSSDAYSMVKLSLSLSKLGLWTVPVAQRDIDGDFGGSPGFWTANIGGKSTQMVGACNKNGVFYAFKQSSLSAGPVWTVQAGNPDSVGPGQCDAGPIFDGTHLFLAGDGTTINGTAFDGSVMEVNPATGQIIWHTGITGSPLGTPGMDGAGVIAAATFGSTTGANGIFLIDASNGQILRTIPYNTFNTFAQPVFADNHLLVASEGLGLRVYGPS